MAFIQIQLNEGVAECAIAGSAEEITEMLVIMLDSKGEDREMIENLYQIALAHFWKENKRTKEGFRAFNKNMEFVKNS